MQVNGQNLLLVALFMKRSRHEASTLRFRESPQSEMKLKLGTSSERVLAIALWVKGKGGRGHE